MTCNIFSMRECTPNISNPQNQPENKLNPQSQIKDLTRKSDDWLR